MTLWGSRSELFAPVNSTKAANQRRASDSNRRCVQYANKSQREPDAQCQDAEDSRHQVKRRPDVVVLDVDLPHWISGPATCFNWRSGEHVREELLSEGA